jgi:hypothetical protein
MRDLGMSWSDLVDRMPTDACFTHALVLNDLMRLREILPDAFASCDLDLRRYYAGCLLDYFRASRAGADPGRGLRFTDRRTEPRGRGRPALGSLAAGLSRGDGGPAARASEEGSEPDPEADAPDDDLPRFPTVFDALDWGERTPRPLGPNVLLAMPGLDGFSSYYAHRHRDDVASPEGPALQAAGGA